MVNITNATARMAQVNMLPQAHTLVEPRPASTYSDDTLRQLSRNSTKAQTATAKRSLSIRMLSAPSVPAPTHRAGTLYRS
jgi:hypothetical protein